MPWIRRLPLALALALAACAKKPPAESPATQPGGQLSIERLLPLQQNTVFMYETFSQETNEHGIAVYEVTRPRATLAELRLAGQIKKRYYVGPDGLKSPTGGFLLKAPIADGAEWQGEDGKVQVTAINEHIQVPAGDFSGCVRTVEQADTANASRKMTTVFCPGVGMTWFQLEGQINGQPMLERLSLKSFGPRFVAGPPQGI
ncbi:MAG TPA: hypothetical protein VGI10_21410 [Polyangiaceae bacterium]|jgi:hypothetical protein